jgi:tetratricopeptide (TPR) repeat protein
MDFNEQELLDSCDPAKREEFAAGLAKLSQFMAAADSGGETESLASACVGAFEKALGPDHLILAKILNILATVAYAQGKNDKAEALYQRSLAIIERRQGPDHPDIAKQLNHLAFVYTAQAKPTQVEAVCRRALSIWERNSNDEFCKEILTSLMALAQSCVVQERYKDAEPLYKRALNLCETSVGAEHPDVVTHVDNLAECYSRQGNYADAEPLRQRVITIVEKTVGPKHLAVAESVYSLSGCYFAQGKYEQAEPLLKRCLAIREEALGLEHPQVVSTARTCIALLRKMNRDAEASQLEQRMNTKQTSSGSPR